MNTKSLNSTKLTAPFLIGSKARISLPVGDLLTGATVFVEPQDERTYRQVHGNRHAWQVLPENDRGFAYMANQQLAYAKSQGLEYYCFCDDDVFGFQRRDKAKADLNTFFKDGVEIMKAKGYSQLMMSFSGHNWFYKGEIKERIGAWCVVINRTQDLLDIGGYDVNLCIFNDWDVSARLIKAGKKTACWYEYQFNHKMNSQKGGAEYLYKKQERLLGAIDQLEAKFGTKAVRRVRGTTGMIEARFNWAKL